MSIQQFTLNRRKFKDAILYIASESHARGDKYFGAVKLNKILYFTDFIAYKRLGQPITGASYMKLREGPSPRPMVPIRNEMAAEHEIEVLPRQVLNYIQYTIVPRVPVNRERLSLSPDELSIIDEVVEEFSGLTAKDVSDLSHQEPGWLAAAYGETIPYETAWVLAGPLPQDAEVSAADLEELPR